MWQILRKNNFFIIQYIVLCIIHLQFRLGGWICSKCSHPLGSVLGYWSSLGLINVMKFPQRESNGSKHTAKLNSCAPFHSIASVPIYSNIFTDLLFIFIHYTKIYSKKIFHLIYTITKATKENLFCVVCCSEKFSFLFDFWNFVFWFNFIFCSKAIFSCQLWVICFGLCVPNTLKSFIKKKNHKYISTWIT